MMKTDREVIEAWEGQGDRERDNGYEGRISLEPPNHVDALLRARTDVLQQPPMPSKITMTSLGALLLLLLST
jgi:hypothetical protein